MRRKGFPAGAACLEQSQPDYESIYANDLEQKRGTCRGWQKQTSKALNYAAMLLATPPILEIGSGAGHLAMMMAAFGQKGGYELGVEVSKSGVEIAKQHAPWARFVCGDAKAQAELFRTETYQTVVAIEVLEHVYNDLALLRAIPKGKLVVASVPDFYGERNGHVRWFGSEAEVKARYGQVLTLHRVVRDEGINSDNRWWIFKGKRT